MKQVTLVTLSEWDKLVTNTYHSPYSFQQQGGCKGRESFHLTVPDDLDDFENTTIPEIVNGDEMGVSFAARLARDPKQPLANPKYTGKMVDFELQLWWERNFYPEVQIIANDLHARGLLASGEYIIDIDW